MPSNKATSLGVNKAGPRIGRPQVDGYYRLYEQDVFRLIHTFASHVTTSHLHPSLHVFKQIFADHSGWYLFAANNGHILPQQYIQALFHTALDCLRRDHAQDFEPRGDGTPAHAPHQTNGHHTPVAHNTAAAAQQNNNSQVPDQHTSQEHEALGAPSTSAMPAMPDPLSPPDSPNQHSPPTVTLHMPTMSHTILSIGLPTASALGGVSVTAVGGDEHEASSRHAGHTQPTHMDEAAAIAAFHHHDDTHMPDAPPPLLHTNHTMRPPAPPPHAPLSFLATGVTLPVAYGAVYMLYVLYMTQPHVHAQRVLLPKDMWRRLVGVAESAHHAGVMDVTRCVCTLARYVGGFSNQAFVYSAVDFPLTMFTSMCVMDRMGKRDLRNTHDQGEQEAEVIRHAAYHVKTALPPLPEATPLQESHAAYVEAVKQAFSLQHQVHATPTDPTTMGFASDPDFVHRLRHMFHKEAQEIAGVLTTINHPAMQDAVASFAAAHNVPTDTQHQAGDGQQAGGKKPRLSDAAGAVAMAYNRAVNRPPPHTAATVGSGEVGVGDRVPSALGDVVADDLVAPGGLGSVVDTVKLKRIEQVYRKHNQEQEEVQRVRRQWLSGVMEGELGGGEEKGRGVEEEERDSGDGGGNGGGLVE